MLCLLDGQSTINTLVKRMWGIMKIFNLSHHIHSKNCLKINPSTGIKHGIHV